MTSESMIGKLKHHGVLHFVALENHEMFDLCNFFGLNNSRKENSRVYPGDQHTRKKKKTSQEAHER